MSVAKRSTSARAVNTQDRTDAEQYEYQRRAFRFHRSVFAGLMITIVLVNLAINAAANITGEWWAWWSGWALIGWGAGVAIHGPVVRLARPRNTGTA